MWLKLHECKKIHANATRSRSEKPGENVQFKHMSEVKVIRFLSERNKTSKKKQTNKNKKAKNLGTAFLHSSCSQYFFKTPIEHFCGASLYGLQERSVLVDVFVVTK